MDNSINEIIKSIDEIMPRLKQIRNKLYENPEIRGTECFASGILASELRTYGFDVEENYCAIPYALKGIYRGRKKGAAIALRDIVDKTGGTIIFYGTPGEENLQTKTTMAPIGASGWSLKTDNLYCISAWRCDLEYIYADIRIFYGGTCCCEDSVEQMG